MPKIQVALSFQLVPKHSQWLSSSMNLLYIMLSASQVQQIIIKKDTFKVLTPRNQWKFYPQATNSGQFTLKNKRYIVNANILSCQTWLLVILIILGKERKQITCKVAESNYHYYFWMNKNKKWTQLSKV